MEEVLSLRECYVFKCCKKIFIEKYVLNFGKVF